MKDAITIDGVIVNYIGTERQLSFAVGERPEGTIVFGKNGRPHNLYYWNPSQKNWIKKLSANFVDDYVYWIDTGKTGQALFERQGRKLVNVALNNDIPMTYVDMSVTQDVHIMDLPSEGKVKTPIVFDGTNATGLYYFVDDEWYSAKWDDSPLVSSVQYWSSPANLERMKEKIELNQEGFATNVEALRTGWVKAGTPSWKARGYRIVEPAPTPEPEPSTQATDDRGTVNIYVLSSGKEVIKRVATSSLHDAIRHFSNLELDERSRMFKIEKTVANVELI